MWISVNHFPNRHSGIGRDFQAALRASCVMTSRARTHDFSFIKCEREASHSGHRAGCLASF